MPAVSKAIPEREHLLDEVVTAYLREVTAGRTPDRKELLARHPGLAAELEEFFADQDHVQRWATPLRMVAAIQAEGTLGDFRIVCEIGRGGMGVVYEAVQISLGRRVALKVLPFAAALDSKQLQRFKNEAQAAAGLQHTNIVPVYFVGCERGVHFYAMQFVEGQTLAALIQELRQANQKTQSPSLPGSSHIDPQPTGPYTAEPKSPAIADEDSPEAENAAATIQDRGGMIETILAPSRSSILDSPSSFFRTVANLGIQAAEALEHAHQLGVIHRDIKPANLMVETCSPLAPWGRGYGGEGVRLWITDFGLAHCQGGCELTMSGDLLGTLRYMSPEQALAKRVIVDERTDIYSLGATLYELLTLEPAFPGSDRQEILRQIAFDDPKPPRKLNKAVPAELETIVLKAIEKSPADRYATAQDLADDLRRYLEDKPIRARRPTLVQRARKWTRRHRSLVLVGAVALLVVLAASILSTVLIWKAYQSEKMQLESSEASLTLAHTVLFETFTQLMQMQRRDDPQSKKAFEAIATKMLNFYEQMEAQHGTDPLVRRKVAHAYHVMAVEVYQKALGEREQARTLFARVFTIAEQLAAEFPGDSDVQFDLSNMHANYATLVREDREWAAAADHYQRALVIVSRLADSFPSERRYRRGHATALHLVGDMLCDQGGHWEEAAYYYREAIRLKKLLIEDFPEEREYPLLLGSSYSDLGLVLLEGRQRREAEESYAQGIKVLKELVDKVPLEPYYRRSLASAHNNLGEVFHTFHDLPAAEQHLREAIRLLSQVIMERPGTPSYQYELAVGYNKLGDVLTEMGEPERAAEQYRLALEHLPKWVTDVLPEYRWERANGLISLGDSLAEDNKIAGAEPFYQEALPICKDLADHFQQPARYGEGLANCTFGLAHVFVITGRNREAKELCQQVLQVARKNQGARTRLSWLLATCPDAELRDHQRALILAEAAVKAAPTDGTTWRSLGVARYRTGDLKGAVPALEKSMKLANGQDESFNTFFLAMVYWGLGEKKKAREWNEKAVAWLKNLPYDPELRRFRAEAADLMGIKDEPLKEKPTDKPKA